MCEEIIKYIGTVTEVLNGLKQGYKGHNAGQSPGSPFRQSRFPCKQVNCQKIRHIPGHADDQGTYPIMGILADMIAQHI